MRPKKSEVERLWADTDKAKQLLNWKPAYKGLQGLKKGLSETIAWFADAENVRKYKIHIYNV